MQEKNDFNLINPERVKTKDLAEILGVVPETIRLRERDGTFKSVGAGKYNLADAVQSWIKYQVNGRANEKQASARHSVEVERARKLKHENDIAEKKVLPVDEVRSVFAAALIGLRQRISAFGPRLSGELAAMTDSQEINQRLTAEGNEALNGCAKALESMASAGGLDTAGEAEEEPEAL